MVCEDLNQRLHFTSKSGTRRHPARVKLSGSDRRARYGQPRQFRRASLRHRGLFRTDALMGTDSEGNALLNISGVRFRT